MFMARASIQENNAVFDLSEVKDGRMKSLVGHAGRTEQLHSAKELK